MTVLEQIREWKKDRKFPEGCEIFFAHGRPVPNVRRQLRRALAIGPRQVDTDRLWTEIGHIERRMLGSRVIVAPEAPTGSTAVRELALQVEEQREEIARQARVIDDPYAEETEIDQLYKLLREKATVRAMLSNRLTLDDPVQNCAILDEIEPVVQAITQIEARIRGLKEAGIKAAEKVQDGRRIVVRRGRGRSYEQYTLEDLYALSLDDLKALKKRVNDDRLKLKKKAGGSRPGGAEVKKEQTIIKAEKALTIRDREWNLINRIIMEKQG